MCSNHPQATPPRSMEKFFTTKLVPDALKVGDHWPTRNLGVQLLCTEDSNRVGPIKGERSKEILGHHIFLNIQKKIVYICTHIYTISIYNVYNHIWASQVALVVKNLPANEKM